MEKLDASHSSGLKGKKASITLFSARQMSKSQNVSDNHPEGKMAPLGTTCNSGEHGARLT